MTARHIRRRHLLGSLLGLAFAIVPALSASAGSLSWLDDVVKDVIRETESGAKIAARSSDSTTRTAARLFANEAEESLEGVARRYEAFGRAGKNGAAPSEALLESRFRKLLRPDSDAVKAFTALAPAEKRVVVEMGEVAQGLARKYPGEAEGLVRKLGAEGLAAVRVYGDDIAPVVAREGAESLQVLRKSGNAGWKFYTTHVLANKKKLAAAGVLALYMADPDRFVDTAGRITSYAVEQFAKAGIELASAVGGGVVNGLGESISTWLTGWGIDLESARYVGMALAGLTVVGATLVLLGMPIRSLFLPVVLIFRLARPRKRVTPGN
ncbi:MAG: hypothetical protein SFX72_19310 [Isosphaeraceae bacterium]|nr:hypothetical protein [Isosphaeraceae bacterium]